MKRAFRISLVVLMVTFSQASKANTKISAWKIPMNCEFIYQTVNVIENVPYTPPEDQSGINKLIDRWNNRNVDFVTVTYYPNLVITKDHEAAIAYQATEGMPQERIVVVNGTQVTFNSDGGLISGNYTWLRPKTEAGKAFINNQIDTQNEVVFQLPEKTLSSNSHTVKFITAGLSSALKALDACVPM